MATSTASILFMLALLSVWANLQGLLTWIMRDAFPLDAWCSVYLLAIQEKWWRGRVFKGDQKYDHRKRDGVEFA